MAQNATEPFFSRDELFRKKVGAFWGSLGVYTHKRQCLVVALKETNFYLPILQLVWPDYYRLD